ncbi:NAD-glutamate dehydrogenase [Williamsia limnetica]|nr:NAD-glutamate dehydrogenase [Williamsia limnetica]
MLEQLDAAQRDLLTAVLRRRDPELESEVAGWTSPTTAQIGRLAQALQTETATSTDEDWEPTEYGKSVHRLMVDIMNLWPYPD